MTGVEPRARVGARRKIAAAMWLTLVGLVAAQAYLLILGRSIEVGDRYGPRGMGVLLGLVIGSLGYALSSRRSDNPVGWLLLSAGLSVSLQGFSEEYAAYALFERPGLPAGAYVGWVTNWNWVVMVGLIGVFCVLRYPTGRTLSGRWARIERASVVAVSVSAAWSSMLPGPLANFTDEVDNPLGVEAFGSSDLQIMAAAPLMIALMGASWSAISRFRRSSRVERLQMKWLVAASAITALVLVVGNGLVAGMYPATINLVEGITMASFLLVPGAMAVAILRYHLYDIDVVINRTIVYGLLTAFLGLAYFGGVALLQALIATDRTNDLTVAATTLAVAALFQPGRRRTQGFIDHYFYRRKYDAQRTVDDFSSRLRDEIDLGSLNGELIEVVARTVQPTHASIWLASPEPRR